MKKQKKIILIIFLIIVIILSTVLILNNKNNSKNETIQSVIIKYAPNGVQTAEELNENYDDNIKILECKVKGKDLLELKEILQKTSFDKSDSIPQTAIAGIYEVNVDNNYKLFLDSDNGYAYYKKNEESFIIKISSNFFEKIANIVKSYNLEE